MINDGTICPVPSYKDKYGLPMRSLPPAYKQWLHKAKWLGWRYPEVKAYLDGQLPVKMSAWPPRINDAIEKLFYYQFISYPAEAELIEAIVRATEAKKVLEIGMWNGFTTLHLIRAIFPYGRVTSIDAFDRRAWKWPDALGVDEVHAPTRTKQEVQRMGGDTLWYDLEEDGLFKFIHGWTPDILHTLPRNEWFDLVFVDSDHSVEHTEKELAALMPITRPGTMFLFHDVGDRENQSSLGRQVRALNDQGILRGWTFPTCMRMDSWHSMGLGIFIREK